MALSLEEKRRRDRERARVKNHAKALAAGRVPGRMGRPPIERTDEERTLLVKAQNRRRTLRTLERQRQRRAEKALAEGRVPGRVGQPRVLTDVQRKANRLASFAKYKRQHLALCRARSVKASKNRRERIRAEQPEVYKAMTAANRAHMRAKQLGMKDATGGLTQAIIRVWDRQGGVCAACSATARLELDHKAALAAGGLNTEDNFQFLCRTCNASKADRDWATWLASRNPLEQAA